VADAAAPGARATILGLATDNGVLPIRLQPLVRGSNQVIVALIGGPAHAPVPSAVTIAAALGLTRAQAEVAALLCRGLETSAISARIGISPNTLNGHLRELYDRLQASNRVQAVVRVLGAAAALTLLSPAVAQAQQAAGPDAHTPK
jgi:DNA-binding CsgD family transcriptional regulator